MRGRVRKTSDLLRPRYALDSDADQFPGSIASSDLTCADCATFVWPRFLRVGVICRTVRAEPPVAAWQMHLPTQRAREHHDHFSNS